MDKPPPPDDDPADAFNPRAAFFFTLGLAGYGLGFWLLTKSHADVGPIVLVSGICSMVWAFL